MRKDKKNHYQLLGVNENVSSAEIKHAYRKLVKNMHPDIGHNLQSIDELKQATEQMMKINEAYATLKDDALRTNYDIAMGFKQVTLPKSNNMANEDEVREHYLRQIFHPSRQAILSMLNLYQKQLHKLSQDIYDAALVADFELYLDKYEATLRSGANSLSSELCPSSLVAAVQMMCHCIAQAADGLEEMRCFCLNFDYVHLTMAQNLVRIAKDLSKQSLSLIKY